MSALLRPGWMREIISNPIKQQAMMSRYTVKRCIGNFTDPVTNRPVRIDMGEVSVRIPFVFRAATSPVITPIDLEGFEVAAPRMNNPSETVNNASGSYVIPGQMLTGEQIC